MQAQDDRVDDTSEFDRPLFKRLARNDTGQAKGHQAGVVIPKDMDEYFPQLKSDVAVEASVPSVQIFVAMYDGSAFLGETETRYQYQTWGGTRPPERRITGNMPLLKEHASGGDILLIERSLVSPDHYRFTLLKVGSAEFQATLLNIGERRWGPLFITDKPASEVQFLAELNHIHFVEETPFTLFDANAAMKESRTLRVARSRAFQTRLSSLYDRKCAMCGFACTAHNGRNETEAAHIIPRNLKGADDSRNGLLLCRSHHWAFDAGLIGINTDRRIIVGEGLAQRPENRLLAEVDGRELIPPSQMKLAPDAHALDWHFRHIVKL